MIKFLMMLVGIGVGVFSMQLVAGCGSQCGDVMCDACGPALTLTFVDDTTGAALSGVTIDHPSGQCTDTAGATTCVVNENRAGSFHFVIGATGYRDIPYEDSVAAVEEGGCCSCGYVETQVEIRMIPN